MGAIRSQPDFGGQKQMQYQPKIQTRYGDGGGGLGGSSGAYQNEGGFSNGPPSRPKVKAGGVAYTEDGEIKATEE